MPATLAALPSTRAIETRSLPTSLAATHRGFAFYVALPESSIPDRDVFYIALPISSIPDLWQQAAVRALQPSHLTMLPGSGTTSYCA